MEDNVKIPLSLFNTVYYMLEGLNPCVVAGDITLPNSLSKQYEEALSGFREKRRTMYLREAYSAISTAKSEQERDICRKRYVYMKQGIPSVDALLKAMDGAAPLTGVANSH